MLRTAQICTRCAFSYSYHFCILHLVRESEKHASKRLAISLPNIVRFSNFFAATPREKFATNLMS